MAKQNAPLLAFNRGLVSSTALVRIDVDRIRLSAEVMTNWLPKTAGSMFLRPGFEWLGSSRNNAFAIDIPFIAATDDTALIEIADGKMRVRVNDQLISRIAVSTTIPNSDFSTSTGWSDGSTGGGSLTFGGSGLVLNAVNIGGLALCRREVTVAGGDAGKRHALSIKVSRGPVTFRCGSTAGSDEYIAETTLRTGCHSLALTPTANFWVQFQSDKDVDRIVASCAVASAGTMEIEAPWASDDLRLVRWDQSADVIFIACKGYQQRRIERRAVDSWSLVLYTSDNGPFGKSRTAAVKLKAGQAHGNTTLMADKAFFKPGHVGALFRLFTPGYNWTFKLSADDAYTKPIRVTGVWVQGAYNDRDWSYTVSGTWTGAIQCQRSFDGPDSGYGDFRASSSAENENPVTGNVSNVIQVDADDNMVIYYRLGFKPGGHASGAAAINVVYQNGGGHGLCRVTGYTSPTQVSVEVLEPFTATDYTDNWQEGIWSDLRGWSSDVAFHKGRLFWIGNSRFIGSVSDDYENFDPEFEGDAGPINRTLGNGPVDKINFALSLTRLLVGTAGSEFSIKSTSIDEPLSPQNTHASDPSTQGSREGVRGIKIDSRGIFAQRSGKRLFELVFDSDAYEYKPRELTLLTPDLTGSAKVVGMSVQRQPDTRIHVWLSDGTVVVLTYEPDEEVTCWSRIETDGFVEGVAVLPGEDEDQVFYRVRRTIGGQTRRYLEKMAMESECEGGTINRQADAFIIVQNVTGTIVTGLSHLEGKPVVVWASGKDMGSYTVSGGSVTLSQAVAAADVLVGLPYEARYKSTKLAYAAAAGTALAQTKRVNLAAVVLGRVHNDGLEFGGNFTDMDRLPRLYQGRPVEPHEVFQHYEEPAIAFPGEWNTDARMCLRARAPRPCVVEAAIVSVETNDKL